MRTYQAKKKKIISNINKFKKEWDEKRFIIDCVYYGGISDETAKQVYNGKTSMHLKTALAVANILGTTVGELFHYEEDDTPSS